MQILLIGNGGREHALAWKLVQSEKVSQLFVAPGNAGTASLDKTKNIDIAAIDIEKLCDFAKQNKIDLTIVGPEMPLSLGIVDLFEKNNLRCFGPNQAASQLESSKAFSKAFMIKNKIPTAAYAEFTQVKPALKYLKDQKIPVVIKADGLAGGKGVMIAKSFNKAEAIIKSMLEDKAFGDASQKIIIEEFLEGKELSYIAITDGEHILPMASSTDHKCLKDGDKGPNTGGMGAISPSPFRSDELKARILHEVIKPTIRAMYRANDRYRGFLYAGIMITPNGDPKVLEFNCRMGDPETQPIMLRLKSDLLELISSCFDGTLKDKEALWDPRPAVGIIMASKGYPKNYDTGKVISGLDQEIDEDDAMIFQAGTKLNDKDEIITNGGRVLCVTAMGEDRKAASDNCYEIIDKIRWDGAIYRKDIGKE